MQYISPFRLLGNDTSLTSLDNADYHKIKKRVIARFELQDNEPLYINNEYISKDQAIDILQQLKSEEEIQHHKSVFLNESLLKFLESGDKSFFDREQIGFDGTFKDWVSPYFAHQFNLVLYNSFKNKEPIRKLVTQPVSKFISPQFENEAYRKTHSFLKNIALEFDNISEKKGTEFNQKAKQNVGRINPLLADKLNVLPDYFSDVRITFAESCGMIAGKLNDHAKNFKLASEYINFATRVHSIPYLQHELDKVKDVVDSNKKSKAGSGGGGSYNWIWFVVVLISVVAKLSRCNSHSYSSRSTPTYISNNNLNVKSILNTEFYLNQIKSSIIKTHEKLDSSQDYILSETPRNGHAFQKSSPKIIENSIFEDHHKIINRTDLDGVLFVRCNSNNKSDYFKYDFYIHAHDSVEFTHKSMSKIEAVGYFGNDWSEDTCAFCRSIVFENNLKGIKNKNIILSPKDVQGGFFTQNANFITLSNLDFENRIISTAHIDSNYFVKVEDAQIVTRVRFD